MKEEIQLAINLWYKEWLQINDPFEEDFEVLLVKYFPDMIFTYDTHSLNYILI